MDIRGEILDFINRNETTGALLITGKWGCGKSYLVRTIAKEQDESKAAAVAIISLFGLDSISAINKRVKEEYLRFSLGLLGRVSKRVSGAFRHIANDGMKVASIAAEGNSVLSAVSHGISAVVDIDPFDFVEVKCSVGKGEKARRFVIVFDDLERSTLEKKELLGAINEFVENRQIKVIIVADEEKITGDEYKEYKEKLISRTIRLSVDYDELIDEIIESYHETSHGYRAFLKENDSLVKQVFAESKTDNLRILKTAIADFERVYDAWRESGIDTSNMGWALYTFVAEVYLARTPSNEDGAEKKEKGSQYLTFRHKDEQYGQKGKNRSSFFAFTNWIRGGLWEKESFITELRMKYGKDESTPVERFLHCQFWDLCQDDIDNGLPVVIQLAYEGQLTRDDLITLLKNIHYLRSNSIKLPCDIDYPRIEDGFKQHIEMIKQGRIEDPVRRTFTENSQIDTEAYPINGLIERADDILVAWSNRSRFINFLCSSPLESSYQLKGLYIETFDDDLLETFIRQYSTACNADKRTLALALLDMAFDSSSYSTDEGIEKSKANFERLIKWLESQTCEDAITTLINQSFIEKIKESTIMSK